MLTRPNNDRGTKSKLRHTIFAHPPQPLSFFRVYFRTCRFFSGSLKGWYHKAHLAGCNQRCPRKGYFLVRLISDSALVPIENPFLFYFAPMCVAKWRDGELSAHFQHIKTDLFVFYSKAFCVNFAVEWWMEIFTEIWFDSISVEFRAFVARSARSFTQNIE